MNKFALITIIICVSFMAFLFVGCSSNSDATREESVEEVNKKSTTKVEDKSITITDNYSYTLPEDFEEIEAANAELINMRNFEVKDGVQHITSYSTNDVEFIFPDDVEGISEDPGAEIGYGGLYDTAIAKITDTVADEGNGSLYRIMFVWPDGADKMCYIEVTDSSEYPEDLAEEVRASIYNCNCDADYECGTYGIEEYYQPSEEEMDRAMLYDAQDAYQDYINGQYEETPVYPYY